MVDGTSLVLINPKKLRKNNTTGVNGVYFNKKAKLYIARINVQGRQISLGCFKKLEDAKEARLIAEEKYYKPIKEKYKKR